MRRIKLDFTTFPADNNKVLTYNFTDSFEKANVTKLDPIPVNKG